MEFVNDRLLRHEVALTDALGTDNCPKLKFLTGTLVAPSTSKVQAPFLQDVIQADAAHMSFGKYTLFSAYANTANMTMASLGFAILFGNEDKHNWTTFWKFIKNIHLAHGCIVLHAVCPACRVLLIEQFCSCRTVAEQ